MNVNKHERLGVNAYTKIKVQERSFYCCSVFQSL